MDTITIIGSIVTGGATIFGGFFTVVKYMVRENVKIQKELLESQAKMSETFLDHLQQKNGHNERIATGFDKTIKEIQPTIVALTNATQRIADQHNNMTSVLDNVTRTLSRCYAAQQSMSDRARS